MEIVVDLLLTVIIFPAPLVGRAFKMYDVAVQKRGSGGTTVILPEVPDVGTKLITVGCPLLMGVCSGFVVGAPSTLPSGNVHLRSTP